MSIRPGRAKGPYVGSDGGAASGANSGIGITVDGNNDININGVGFYDSFEYYKDFWKNKPLITSGDWQYDSAGERLEGIAQNNSRDSYRQNIEGNFDHWAHFTCGSDSNGFWFIGNAEKPWYAEFKYNRNTNTLESQFFDSGGTRPPFDTVIGDFSEIWMRVKRVGHTIYQYYKTAAANPWTLYTSYVASDGLGPVTDAQFDSADSSYINEVFFLDNSMPKMWPHRELVAAGSIVPDVSQSDLLSVTLTGAHTLSNPLHPKGDGQMIIFRIRQDATGGRTLAFDSKYNFSTTLPSPTVSTAANAIDYLGFIYNIENDTWDYIAEVKGF